MDPACGSGSFLIKVVDIIAEKYKSLGYKDEELLKRQIIDENIYGVDLDPQAVEITRLNLLINALSEKTRFSPLKNIKNGNSLTFDWKEEYPEAFKQGGFDVIIGNPPYIKEDANREAFNDLHSSPYYQARMDIWTMFGCICIDLLKENGELGFIAPSSWLANAGASIFRNKVLKDGELKIFIDFGDYKVFEQAGIQTMIFVFEKKQPSKKYGADYIKITDKNITEDKLVSDIFGKKARINIEPEKLFDENITFLTSELNPILIKLSKKANYYFKKEDIGNGIDVLQDFVNASHLSSFNGENVKKRDGIFILSKSEIKKLNLNEKELAYLKPYYDSKQINRYLSVKLSYYKIIYADKFFRENINLFPNLKNHIDKFKKVLSSAFAPYGLNRPREEKFFNGDGIFLLRKTMKPAFTYVDFPCYVTRAFLVIKPENLNLKYALGLLNSNLMLFWLKSKGKRQGEQLQIDKGPLLQIPIFVGDKNQQKQIIILVDKMLELNKKLQETTENSEKWNAIKAEIEKTDKKIDQEVYKLYGLTEEEIKIVENN